MRKLGIVLAALFVAACTHSVDGTGDNKNGGGGLLGDTTNNGGGTNDGKQALGNDTNGTAPANKNSCSIETGDATCNACASKSCCPEIDACNGSQDCSALWSCLVKCGEDRTCGNDCVAQHPNGKDGVQKLVACGEAKCTTECQ